MPFAEQPLIDQWIATRDPHEASYLSQIFEQESNNTPDARSGTGAVGLGQITRGTWRDTARFAAQNLDENELPEGMTFEQLSDPSSFDSLATDPFANAFVTWANMRRLEAFALDGGGSIDGINDKRIRSGGESAGSLLDALGGDTRQWATIVSAGHKDGMGRMRLFTDDAGQFDFTPAREFYNARRESFQARAQQARADADGLRATGNIEEADALARRARSLATSDSTGHVFGFADRVSTRVAADAGIPPLEYSPAEVADFIELRAPGHSLDNPAVARFAAQAEVQGLDFNNLRESAAMASPTPEVDLSGATAQNDVLPAQNDFDLPQTAGLPPQQLGTDTGFTANPPDPVGNQVGGQDQLGQSFPNPTANPVSEDAFAAANGADSLALNRGQSVGQAIGQGFADLPGTIDDALNISGDLGIVGQGAQDALGFIDRGLIQPIQNIGRNVELGVQQGGQLLGEIGQSVSDFATDLFNPNGISAADQRFNETLSDIGALTGTFPDAPLDTVEINAGIPQVPNSPLLPEGSPLLADPVQTGGFDPARTRDAFVEAVAASRLGTLAPSEFDALTGLASQQRDEQTQLLRNRAIALAANENLPSLRNNETALANLDAGGITSTGTGAALRELSNADAFEAPSINFGAINAFANDEANNAFQTRAGTQVTNQIAANQPGLLNGLGPDANLFDPFSQQLGRVTAGLNQQLLQGDVLNAFNAFDRDNLEQAEQRIRDRRFSQELQTLLSGTLTSQQNARRAQ